MYSVGQLNHIANDGSDAGYATEITTGSVKTWDYSQDEEATGIIGFNFQDNYLEMNNNFEVGVPYYVHAKVFRLPSVQQFKIKLVDSVEHSTTQYIKMVTINLAVKPESNETTPDMNEYFADVEFIFTPLVSNFNGILFELVRNADDMIVGENQQGQQIIVGRKSSIAFMEVSVVQNKNPLGAGKALPKIGVQSRPSLMLCINKEEIHVSRAGIFELRDGIVPITFFSVVNGATLNSASSLDTWESGVYDGSATDSIQLLGESKTRTIDSYTLDYLYSN